MVRYRRNRVEGGCYFFTVTLRDRCSDLLVKQIDILRQAFTTTRFNTPFTISAIVVLPDLLHTVWTLPEGDSNYPARWCAIKANFTRQLRKQAEEVKSPWQPRYWEHTIRDDRDYRQHLDYIHYNPVKHGYVMRVRDWSHSSFHRYVESGAYPIDWGVGVWIFPDYVALHPGYLDCVAPHSIKI